MIDYKGLLYYAGTHLRIIFARPRGQNLHAKEFLDSLEDKSLLKLDRVLKRLADYGKVKNKEQFRSVGEDLWEVKEPGGKRLVGYFLGAGHFVLTHGFQKRGGGRAANKFPPEERDRAIRIRQEFEFKCIVRGSSK